MFFSQSPGTLPCKFFIGCLPNSPETSTEELRTYFGQYGSLSDVYIPKPYRGFGFVTFLDGYEAQVMYREVHVLRNSRLNVSIAEPKPGAKGGSDLDYQRTAVAPYAPSTYQTAATGTTPTHVYAYSLVPTSSTPSNAYVPGAQYYTYQSGSGTTQPQPAYFTGATGQYSSTTSQHKDYQ